MTVATTAAAAASTSALAEAFAARVGILGFLSRPWPTLSGGQASRAALAVAVGFCPDVFVLNEVTAGLDAAALGAPEAAMGRLVGVGGVAVL